MNAAVVTVVRWAQRCRPQLAMCIATMAGLVVAYALRPSSDLAMNLTVGACMVAVQAVMYALLVLSNRAVMPPPILVSVVALTVIVTLLLIL